MTPSQTHYTPQHGDIYIVRSQQQTNGQSTVSKLALRYRCSPSILVEVHDSSVNRHPFDMGLGHQGQLPREADIKLV